MIFGYDKYVELGDDPTARMKFPLPNGRLDANKLPKTFSELSQYDVYCALFNKNINYSDNEFKHANTHELVEAGTYFIYPVLIRELADFHNLLKDNFFALPEHVVKAVQNRKAVILLAYLFEGDFYLNNKKIVNVINLFVEKYNLPKKGVLLVNSNLLLKYDQPEGANFIAKPFNYFLLSPWFLPSQFLDDLYTTLSKNAFVRRIHQVCTHEKIKKFLCLNRRPRPHRVAIFTEIKKDEKLANNTMISLGKLGTDANYVEKHNTFKQVYGSLVDNSFKYDKSTGLDFLSSYNENNDTVIDAGLDYNLALNINETLHSNTFVSIITETLYNDKTIFLSEKIWKPLFAGQPFIVLGNPGTLRELKALGFKTFSEYWDESYDDEPNFTRRLEKVLDVMHYINNIDSKTLLEMTNRMKPILVHNFNTYVTQSKNELFRLKKILNEAFY